MTAFSKLTEMVDGEPRIVSDPPLIERVEDISGDVGPRGSGGRVCTSCCADTEIHFSPIGGFCWRSFGWSTSRVRWWVWGVSVRVRGLRLMLGRDESDPLFLQFKEAESSVLEDYTAKSGYANHGQRVVAGQHLMQASSDIFLGWLHVEAGIDGVARDFYGRQLKDWKGSFETAGALPKGVRTVRPGVRLDARPSPRPLGRSDRDRRLSRGRRRVRPGHRRLLGGIRRPERPRLRRPQGRRRRWKDHRQNRPLSGNPGG